MAEKGGTVPVVKELSDKELRENLKKLGFPAGPITNTTRDVLARKLRRLSLTKTDEPSTENAAVSKVKKVQASNGQEPPHSGAGSSNKKDIFISYSRDVERRQFIQKLKRYLESKGYSVFVDTEDIQSGSDWHSVIGEAVQNCRALVPVLTQKYLSSQYCKNELYMASQIKKPIFPVILEEVDFLASKDGSGVLLAISSVNWVDFKNCSFKDGSCKLHEGLKHLGVEPSSTKSH